MAVHYLQLAVARSNTDIIRAAAAAGVSMEMLAMCEAPLRMLAYAISRSEYIGDKMPDVVRALLECGAKVNGVSMQGSEDLPVGVTALDVAVSIAHTQHGIAFPHLEQAIRLLEEAGAKTAPQVAEEKAARRAAREAAAATGHEIHPDSAQ